MVAGSKLEEQMIYPRRDNNTCRITWPGKVPMRNVSSRTKS
jgi:hypothetical protein